MRIRKAEQSDFVRIHEIEQCSFAEPWSMDLFLSDSVNPNSVYYVAEVDGIVVGFATYIKVLDEGEITDIAVVDNYRCRGIGRKMLEKLLDDMREKKLSMATLEARRTNLPARRLYESEGFKLLGYRPKYYGNEDAAIYSKDLI